MRFQDKVVLLTGGASGIGKETCLHFLREGASLAFIDYNNENGIATQLEFQKQGYETLFIQADISKEEDVENAVKKVVKHFGKLNVLVNNAANAILKSFNATVEDWQTILGVNIIGNFLTAKYASEEMKKIGGGAIVNICSISGIIAQPNQMTYNASKAGIIGLTRCMALELAPYNIRVNAVSPGYVRTAQLDRDIRVMGMSEQDVKEQWGSKHMLGRISSTDEVAPMVLFLANDKESSFVTAANFVVDGGYTQW